MATQKRSSSFNIGLFIVCACFFMTSLDITIVNVALPVMIVKLHAPLNQVIWVINAYLLIFAVLAVLAGRLGDILGQRRMFFIGLFVFTLASALCGFSQQVLLLIGARVLQGLGGACISATSLPLLTSVVPADRRGRALGIYASMIALAGIAGPIAGGWIVSTLGWNWIFFVNVPIGLLLAVGTFAFIPRVKIARQHHFDIGGALFGAVGLFCLIFSAVEGPTYHWGTIIGPLNIALILGVGVVSLLLFCFWERAQIEPFLPLFFFKNWFFASMIISQATLAFTAFGLIFLLTLYLEAAIGMSPLVAGLTIAPYMLAVLVTSPLIGRIVDKFGGRHVLLGSMFFFSLSLGILAYVSGTNSNWLTFVLPLILVGIGMAGSISSVLGEVLRSVPRPMVGTASGIISTTRVVGGSLGVAITSSLLQSGLFASVRSQMADTLRQVPPDQRQTFSNYLGALAQNNVVAHTTLPIQLQHLAQKIYTESFVSALHLAQILLVAVVFLGFLSVFSAKYSTKYSISEKQAAFKKRAASISNVPVEQGRI